MILHPEYLAVDVDHRNDLRREAMLPLLNAGHEVAVAMAIQEQQLFDRAFDAYTLLHPIDGAGRGWMARLGQGAKARRKFRNALAT